MKSGRVGKAQMAWFPDDRGGDGLRGIRAERIKFGATR